VVEGQGLGDGGAELLFRAVRRGAGSTGAGSLLVSRIGTVVLLANQDVDWDKLRGAVLHELKSELVRTLSVYLEQGGNYDATAEALVVHRNTLKYRLQRIRDLSGHDVNDPDSHFNLQLATRAWATLRALRS
jgi:hypothetical protein